MPSLVHFDSKKVLAGSFMTHELACQRMNFRCPKCNSVIPVSQKDKHTALVHTPIKCECGVVLEPVELSLHKEFECKFRLVACQYCKLRVAFDQRGPHQAVCGNRTVVCNICTKIHKRNAIYRHLRSEHGIEETDQSFLEHYFQPTGTKE